MIDLWLLGKNTILFFIVVNLFGLIGQAILTGEFVFTWKIILVRFIISFLLALMTLNPPTTPPTLIQTN